MSDPTAGERVVPMMDRPAYELVRLIEAQLDDADQITDTPQRPNRILAAQAAEHERLRAGIEALADEHPAYGDRIKAEASNTLETM